MSDYRRAQLPGGVYFFTVVTQDRRPIFVDEATIDRLRRAFQHVRASHPFEIDAIVIMPDHLHTIWRLPERDGDFSARWRLVKRHFSLGTPSETNHRREKAIWQRRFWEHLLRDQQDWQRHMDYVHYNPVKHGYVAKPGDWRWTSFHRLATRGWYNANWGESVPESISGMEHE